MRTSSTFPVRETPPHCATCANYHSNEQQGGQTGECRLFPRALSGSPAAGNLSERFPIVAATDYCSAHPEALTEPRI